MADEEDNDEDYDGDYEARRSPAHGLTAGAKGLSEQYWGRAPSAAEAEQQPPYSAHGPARQE